MKHLTSLYIPTLVLRITLIGLCFVALLFCAFLLPNIYENWPKEFPDYSYLALLIVSVIGATAMIFYIVVGYIWKLLKLIDQKKSFSKESVLIMKKVKVCAFIISGLYVALMPVVYAVAESDDAPGLIVFGAAFCAIPFVVAVFADVVEKLFDQAITLKNENDLTV